MVEAAGVVLESILFRKAGIYLQGILRAVIRKYYFWYTMPNLPLGSTVQATILTTWPADGTFGSPGVLHEVG